MQREGGALQLNHQPLLRAGGSGPVFGIAALRRELDAGAPAAPAATSTPAKAGQKRAAESTGCVICTPLMQQQVSLALGGPCGGARAVV